MPRPDVPSASFKSQAWIQDKYPEGCGKNPQFWACSLIRLGRIALEAVDEPGLGGAEGEPVALGLLQFNKELPTGSIAFRAVRCDA